MAPSSTHNQTQSKAARQDALNAASSRRPRILPFKFRSGLIVSLDHLSVDCCSNSSPISVSYTYMLITSIFYSWCQPSTIYIFCSQYVLVFIILEATGSIHQWRSSQTLTVRAPGHMDINDIPDYLRIYHREHGEEGRKQLGQIISSEADDDELLRSCLLLSADRKTLAIMVRRHWGEGLLCWKLIG